VLLVLVALLVLVPVLAPVLVEVLELVGVLLEPVPVPVVVVLVLVPVDTPSTLRAQDAPSCWASGRFWVCSAWPWVLIPRAWRPAITQSMIGRLSAAGMCVAPANSLTNRARSAGEVIAEALLRLVLLLLEPHALRPTTISAAPRQDEGRGDRSIGGGDSS
jgi:hypothetical protein